MSSNLRIVDQRVRQALKGSETVRAVVDSVHGRTAVVRFGGSLLPALVRALPVTLVPGMVVECERPRGVGGQIQIVGVLGVPGSAGGTADGLASVVIRASGYDDGSRINEALAAAEDGTTFHFPDSEYIIETEVVVSKDNIRFVGRGGQSNPDNGGRTRFTRSTAGRMLTWDKVPGGTAEAGPTPANVINGGGIEGIYLWGSNGVATVGIRIVSARNMMFKDFTVSTCDVGIQTTNHGTAAGGADIWDNSAGNTFEDGQIIVTDGVGMSLDGNFYAATFRGIRSVATSSGGLCLDIIACDDLWFYDCTFVVSHAGGIGVRATGGDYGGVTGATGIHFFGGFLNGSGGTDLQTIADGLDIVPIIQFHGMGTVDGEPVFDLDDGSRVAYTDMQGRHNLQVDGRTTLHMQDDFGTPGLTSETIGELRWSLLGGTVTVGSNLANHPGLRTLTTPASTALCGISLPAGTGNGLLLPSETFDSVFILKTPSNDSDTMVRVGWGLAFNGDPPDHGLYFEKLYGDTTWYAVSRASGAQTRSAALATITTNGWVRLRIRRVNSTTIGYDIGDTVNLNDNARLTTNIPTSSLCGIFQVRSQSGVAKAVDIDYFQLHITGMAR